MDVVLIRHARDRMTLRGITETMLMDCLEKPDAKAKGYAGREVFYKRYGDKYISVVFEVHDTTRHVITAIWKDKLKN